MGPSRCSGPSPRASSRRAAARRARAVERATEARASLQLAADLAGALAAQLATSQNLLSPLGLNIPDPAMEHRRPRPGGNRA
jgi:hypothetical protein